MLKQNRQTGFTLTETLIVVGILGILAALAIPSYNETTARRRIIAAAEVIHADLHWARSEAIKRNTDVTVTFNPGEGGAWSYSINPDFKTVNSGLITEFQDVSLTENFGNDDIVFDRVRGTSDDSGMVVLNNSAGELHIILGIIGRARICSVDGSISKYQTCSP